MSQKLFCYMLLTLISTSTFAQTITLSDLFNVHDELHTTSAGTLSFDGTCLNSPGAVSCSGNGATLTMTNIHIWFCATTSTSTINCQNEQHYALLTGSLTLTQGTSKTLTLNSTAADAIRAITNNAPSAGSIQGIMFNGINGDIGLDNCTMVQNEIIIPATCSSGTCTSSGSASFYLQCTNNGSA